jgi:hypothetical protein
LRQASLQKAKLDCASFDSSNLKDMRLTHFGGKDFSKTAGGAYRSIADSWHDANSKKRDRVSTTVMVGNDAVLRKNNYSWDSDLGRALEGRDVRPVHVSYKVSNSEAITWRLQCALWYCD